MAARSSVLVPCPSQRRHLSPVFQPGIIKCDFCLAKKSDEYSKSHRGAFLASLPVR